MFGGPFIVAFIVRQSICWLASSVEALTNCSWGGNSRLSHRSGVGGASHCLILVVFVCGHVSETEEHLMPTLHVLFRNQVVEANQFTFYTLVSFTP
jgi:hypothetical protein